MRPIVALLSAATALVAVHALAADGVQTEDFQSAIDEAAAKAVVPERDGAYPEAFMFSQMALPAYGFYVRHADNVVFDNVEVKTAAPDARPRLVVEDGTFVEL